MKLLLGLAGVVGVGLAVWPCAAAGVDRNGNLLSDVWELVYGVLPSGTDSDGDGFTNLQESLAGTNPMDANSRPPRVEMSRMGFDGRFDWAAVPGKRYQLQERAALGVGNWTTVFTAVGTEGAVSTVVPLPGSENRFFRVAIDDVDSDADGLTDYEEATLGLNPRKERTFRQDATDLETVTAGLSAANTITVAVLDATASERWNEPALVAVRRSGGLNPLTVNVTFGGTAVRDADYTAVAPVVFGPGVREAWIEIFAIADAEDAEATETVTVTLAAGTGYTVGAQNLATVSIENEPAGALPRAKEAARFLLQAAFGPDQDSAEDADEIPENVEDLMGMGFAAWIEDQFARPVGLVQPWVDWAVDAAPQIELHGNWKEFSWWGRAMGSPKLRPDAAATQAPDPLRQRVAFALSQILVVSDRPEVLTVEQRGMANYYDLMVRHAFGNYRDLLIDVAMHPAMGIYLSHLGNQKADPVNRIYPDENFAREIMQLFTIGLWQLNADGTRVLSNGQPIPTYNNSDITELARVFTGFSFGNNEEFRLHPRDFTVQTKCWDAYHDCEPKTLLGLSLPARTPSAGNTGTAGMADLNAAVNNLFQHPNVGPFIGKQLIQRLVTSNPSPEYVGRVSAAFANNGSGVRGDMKAVVRAILLDPEARATAKLAEPTWGKLREPFLRVVNMARAFNATSPSGYYALDQFTMDHAQDPMSAPSVFNFFLPAHSPPGPITEAGLVAPEFQVLNATTAVTGPNYFWNAIAGGLHRYGVGNAAYNVTLNLAQELAMVCPANQVNMDVPTGPAMDPDPLLRRLDLALTGGMLSPQQFQIIREAMLRIGTGSWMWHRERLRLAIYLIVTSPDFNVQR